MNKNLGNRPKWENYKPDYPEYFLALDIWFKGLKQEVKKQIKWADKCREQEETVEASAWDRGFSRAMRQVLDEE